MSDDILLEASQKYLKASMEIIDLRQEVAALTSKLARYEEALRFVASPASCDCDSKQRGYECCYEGADVQTVAREALEG